jgi:hypothetical protein
MGDEHYLCRVYVSNRKITAITTRHEVDGAVQVTQQVSRIVYSKNYKEKKVLEFGRS